MTATLLRRLDRIEAALSAGETQIIRTRPDGTATVTRLRWPDPPEAREAGAAETAALMVGAVRIVRSFGGQS